LTDSPAPGGFFEQFLADYKPPAKPFPVILPRGELFLFTAIPDEAAWDALRKEAMDMARRIQKGVPVKFAEVAGKNPSRNALAYVCYKTMVGMYRDYDTDDAGNPVGMGEMLPAWGYAEWLQFARDVPTVFDAVKTKVDEGQVQQRALGELTEVRAEKKD
jgi:hypothetical protein